MSNDDIIPNLFRTEYSKIVAVLIHRFGIEHMALAEDMASESFTKAMETWPYEGIPKNPTGWLYTVAKNIAKNHFARDKIFRDKISRNLNTNDIITSFELDLTDKNITDSQLLMLFVICHPAIPEMSQIMLALRVLCGFGNDEIADAFLTNVEQVNKRLYRAKKKLRKQQVEMKLPNIEERSTRLSTVLHTIYLLFSEGYYSERHDGIIRKELCLEAMNLGYLLLKNTATNTHESNALMSLMCFQASRLEARQTTSGKIILYDDQDEAHWNTELIEKGFHYLQQASTDNLPSKYYLEASIAYWYTVKNNTADKWESILKLYDLLLKIEYSPVSELNRLYAMSKVKGKAIATKEALKLDMTDNHFYYMLLSNLNDSDPNKADHYLLQALNHCKNESEKILIKEKIEKLNSKQ